MAGVPSDVAKDTGNMDDFVKDLVKFDPGGSSVKPSPSLVDVFVYRAGRQSVAFGNKKISAPESIKRTHSQASFGKRISGKASSFLEYSSLRFRGCMLLIIEMFISYAWYVIRDRRRRSQDLLTEKVTIRMELMDIYLKRGIAGFGAIFAGYVADTYVGIYPIAVINVVLHFIVCSVLLMEDLIKYDDFDLYHGVFWKTVGWSFIPLKATDFARMAFGLEHIGRKNMNAVLLYVFFSVWLNERSCGGIAVLVISVFHFSEVSNVRLSFFVTAISSGLYVFRFRPDPSKTNFISGLGNKVVGIILTALRTKWKLQGAAKYDAVIRIKYEKIYVTKSQQLLRVYLMIIPTVGLLFFVTSRSDFYVPLWHRMTADGLFQLTGIINGARIITLTTMALISLVILPILQKLGYKRNFLCRFAIGYISSLICYYYASTIMWAIESTEPPLGVGLMRFINAGTVPLTIISRDPRINFNDTIPNNGAIMLAVSINSNTMYKMMFRFGNSKNFTRLVSVARSEPTAYVALDPSEVIRIKGILPIWESPPGFNAPYQARMHISNFIRRTNCSVIFRYLLRDKTGVFGRTKKRYKVNIQEGKSSDLQLPAGVYHISVREFDLTGNRTIVVGSGGAYLIILFRTPTANKMFQDTLVEENKLSAWYTLGISIPYAMTLVLSYVSLRAFLYVNTPEGLEGLSLGFLESLENNTSWVIWLGFQTWHPFITSSSIATYSMILTLLFIIYLFVLVKNNSHYRW